MSFDVKKINLKDAFLDFLIITVGVFISAVAIYFFMFPSGVTIGKRLSARDGS